MTWLNLCVLVCWELKNSTEFHVFFLFQTFRELFFFGLMWPLPPYSNPWILPVSDRLGCSLALQATSDALLLLFSTGTLLSSHTLLSAFRFVLFVSAHFSIRLLYPCSLYDLWKMTYFPTFSQFPPKNGSETRVSADSSYQIHFRITDNRHTPVHRCRLLPKKHDPSLKRSYVCSSERI